MNEATYIPGNDRRTIQMTTEIDIAGLGPCIVSVHIDTTSSDFRRAIHALGWRNPTDVAALVAGKLPHGKELVPKTLTPAMMSAIMGHARRAGDVIGSAVWQEYWDILLTAHAKEGATG